MIPVAILAGGLATRLKPITNTIPKSMVEVAGVPFIAHQLIELQRQGVEEIVLCLGHFGEQVESFVKDGSEYGVRVQYSYETQGLLGTGGAIRNALDLLDDVFFVLYGDSWLDIDYNSVYESFYKSGNSALMSVFRNEGLWDTSNVEMSGERIKTYSKEQRNTSMTHIDYGLGILKHKVFENYPENVNFDLAEIYELLSKKGDLASFEVTQRFYEVGSHDGLMELNKILSVRLEALDKRVEAKTPNIKTLT
jgi:N-acetyl-alpha-D-muramate 1-phosphate uridylyltransferase